MARQSYAAKKAKIQKEMERLQRQIEILESKNRQPVIDSIVRSMKEYEITIDELSAALNKGSRSKSKTASNKSGSGSRGPVAPKYLNPATGETWTGRGKAPRWIVEAEAQGKTRSEFLINPVT